MSGWAGEPLAGFDLETTGTDVERDRVVSGAWVLLGPGGRLLARRSWLLDPGVPVPEAATAVHGLDTAHVRRHGGEARAGIEEMTAHLAASLAAGTPLVVMNAKYDLTLLDRECRRHGLATLTARLGGPPAPVVDPLVLDRHADHYRRGKRNLGVLCALYGVALDRPHEAGADAVAAAGVARRMGGRHPALGALTAPELHALQVRAAAEQGRARLRRHAAAGAPGAPGPTARQPVADAPWTPSAPGATAWPVIPPPALPAPAPPPGEGGAAPAAVGDAPGRGTPAG
ncbi:exonuclease domain-containing protein [Streptomyces hoynatensis]|uniref:exonuclease domain-containing protein n=1 Tax=Streptomyces hoynatensis TaxID=1141874 RepID=UPI0026A7F9DD